MRLRVYQEVKEVEEKEIFFRLFPCEPGKIILSQVSKFGSVISAGNVLTITKDGILLCTSFEGDLPVDSKSRVVVIK